MTISLTPQLEAMIRKKVDSGLYDDANDVVSEALRLLEERDRRARLNAAIDEGLAEIARGEDTLWTPDTLRQIQDEADEEDRLERLRDAIAIGDEQLARGQYTTWTADSMRRLIQEADAEDRQGLPRSSFLRERQHWSANRDVAAVVSVYRLRFLRLRFFFASIKANCWMRWLSVSAT